MKRVILESPFAGDVARNLHYLRACLRDSLLRGESPLASHGLYTQPGVLRDDVPAERDAGIEAGFAWRPFANATVVYTDLGISGGMQRGIDDAKRIARLRGEEPTIEYRQLGEGWDRASEPHDFEGDGCDCERCGEGRQFYLHTDREESP